MLVVAVFMVMHLVRQTGVLIYATFSVVSTFFQFEEHMTAFFASLAILVQVLCFYWSPNNHRFGFLLVLKIYSKQIILCKVFYVTDDAADCVHPRRLLQVSCG